ncbi:MFS transporter [Mycoplasmatota bacterium WC30]
MKKERYLIVMFFLIQNIIHNLGHPVTPEFVRSLGIQDYMFGVFFATMSLGLMIGGPIWGSLGDKGKKKLYIVIGLLMYSVGQFGFGYAGNQYIMVIFRILSGLGVVSSITLFTSHLIEITEKKDRARFLAYVGAAVTLGASLGYYLGGFISSNAFTRDLFNITNNKEIFLIQALLNILYIGVVVLLFKDRKCAMPSGKKTNPFEGFKFVKQIDFKLILFLIALAFITMGAINLNKFIDVYFNDLSFDTLELGTFKMVTGMVSLFASIFLVPFFARIKKRIGLMIVIQILSAIIVFYTFRSATFLLTVYTIYMMYIILKAIFTPLEQNYISSHAKEGEYGKIMGIRQSFLSIGMVLGPLIGGILYEYKPLWLFDSSAIAFIIGFGILLVVLILYKKEKITSENG